MPGGVEPQSEAARLYTVRVDAIVGILFFKMFLNKLFDVSGQVLLKLQSSFLQFVCRNKTMLQNVVYNSLGTFRCDCFTLLDELLG